MWLLLWFPYFIFIIPLGHHLNLFYWVSQFIYALYLTWVKIKYFSATCTRANDFVALDNEIFEPNIVLDFHFSFAIYLNFIFKSSNSTLAKNYVAAFVYALECAIIVCIIWLSVRPSLISNADRNWKVFLSSVQPFAFHPK